MSSPCGICESTPTAYECHCSSPPLLLCPACVDSHLDHDGRHSLKKIKCDPKRPSPSVISESLCKVCESNEPTDVCCCSFPVTPLCERCKGTHTKMGLVCVHPMYPIDQKKFIGGLEDYEKAKLRATYRQCAVERLNQNMQKVDSAEETIQTYFETLAQTLVAVKTEKLQELRSIRNRLSEEIHRAGRDTNTMDPTYEPQDDIAKLIWNFQPSADVSGFQLFEFTIEMEIGRNVISGNIGSTVRFSRKKQCEDKLGSMKESAKAAVSDELLLAELQHAYHSTKSKPEADLAHLPLREKATILLGFLYDKRKSFRFATNIKANLAKLLLEKTSKSAKLDFLQSLSPEQLIPTSEPIYLCRTEAVESIREWLACQLALLQQSFLDPSQSASTTHMSETDLYKQKALALEIKNTELSEGLVAAQSLIDTLRQTICMLTQENEALRLPIPKDLFSQQVFDLASIMGNPLQLFHLCGYPSPPTGPATVSPKKIPLVRKNKLHMFDCEGRRWTAVSMKKSIEIDEMTGWCLVDADRCFVCGGNNKRQACIVEVQTGTVIDLPSMKDMRAGAGMICAENSIYVFGGVWYQDGTPVPHVSAEAYSLSRQSWSALPNMSHARACLNLCLYYQLIVILGGCVSTSVIEVFSLKTNAYVRTPMMVTGPLVPALVHSSSIVCFLGATAYCWNPKIESGYRLVQLTEWLKTSTVSPSASVGRTAFVVSATERVMYWIDMGSGSVQIKPLP